MFATPRRPIRFSFCAFKIMAAALALIGMGFALAPAVALAQGKAQGQGQGRDKPPILIGFDGEFSALGSTSAQAIERGIRVAMAEINDAGGLLGGRKLDLVTKDNRASPARGVANVKAFAEMPDLVAVFGGRFSPVVVETVKAAHSGRLITLAAWSSADDIVENGLAPNYAFRIGLCDRIAMPAMIDLARKRGATRVGLLLANTSWGRSNLASAKRHLAARPDMKIVATVWYNWGEPSLKEHYDRLLAAGAETVLLVANDREGIVLINEMVGLPPEKRLPVVSHWGVTGGDFAAKVGAEALAKVDFAVIQTFSFFKADPKKTEKILARTKALFNIARIEDIDSPVGFGHAYDLTHILARAIAQAGSADRARVRAALEQVKDYNGLSRRYARPFAPNRHDAAEPRDVFFVKYRSDGVLVPIPD